MIGKFVVGPATVLLALGAGYFVAARVASPLSASAPAPQQAGKPPRSELERVELLRRHRAQKLGDATARWRSGRRSEAEREIVAAGAYGVLARLYEDADEPAKAYAYWKKHLLSNPLVPGGAESTETTVHVAKLAERYGTPRDAETLWRKAAGSPRPAHPTDPNDPGVEFDATNPNHLRAAAHLRLARAMAPGRRSVDEFVAALTLRPGWGDAYFWLGDGLAVAGRHREAVVALTRAAALGSPAVKRAAERRLPNETYFASQQERGKMPDPTPRDGSSLFRRLPST
jgi:tetratricopeptide (TPR) repeat protein